MARKNQVNRIEYNSSTGELTIYTDGGTQYVFDMDLVGQSGGASSWDDLTGKPSSTPAEIDNVVENAGIGLTKITVVNSLTHVAETFDTLQTAFDSIPAATNSTEIRIRYNVFIPGGDYDENLQINTFNRNINVICVGVVNLGQFNNDVWEASNSRNLTINHFDDNDDNTSIDSIIDNLTITSYYYDDGIPSHSLAYRSGFRISGDVILVDSKFIHSLAVSFHHVRVNGTVDFTDHTGVLAFYTTNSFYNDFTGSLTSTDVYLAHSCKFVGAWQAHVYYRIDFCRFYSGITIAIVPVIDSNEPFGFYNCYIEGNFDGPDGSFILDTSTNYYFVQNGGSIPSGTNKVLLFSEA